MKSTTRKKVFKLFYLCSGLTLITILILNIIYSQNINSLFTGLVQEDRKSIVNYLKKIKKMPDFMSSLSEYQKIYGISLVNDVFHDDRTRKQTIDDLENILQRSPNSRDVLYNLYLLNEEEGKFNEAQNYLERAKALDPDIEN